MANVLTCQLHTYVSPTPDVAPLALLEMAKYLWREEFLSDKLSICWSCQLDCGKHDRVRREPRHAMGSLQNSHQHDVAESQIY